VVRLACESDVEQIRQIYRPFVETNSVSFEAEFPGHDAFVDRVVTLLKTLPWLVAVDFTREEPSAREFEEKPTTAGGRVRGFAYAAPHRARAAYQWSVEASAYVEPSRHRSGVGRLLYQHLFSILARQGFVTAYAGITLPNPRSVGFHESVGFSPLAVYRHVGFKLGSWHDVGWWERQIQEPPLEPRAPIPLPEISDALAPCASVFERVTGSHDTSRGQEDDSSPGGS